MSESEKALAILFFGAGQFFIDELNKKRKVRKQRSVWIHNWVKRRQELGCYAQLLQEIKDEVPYLYRNFLRMHIDDFNNLLLLVSPLIRKQNTTMRKSISAGERLALTLRFLGSGDSFMSLQYLFRIPQPTITTIIPEVCNAIYKVLLPNYFQVHSNNLYILLI